VPQSHVQPAILHHTHASKKIEHQLACDEELTEQPDAADRRAGAGVKPIRSRLVVAWTAVLKYVAGTVAMEEVVIVAVGIVVVAIAIVRESKEELGPPC
jgi:hypothetical protein